MKNLKQISLSVGLVLVASTVVAFQVRDGEIFFDYRLRPGVVTHSNAIALMRSVGLPV